MTRGFTNLKDKSDKQLFQSESINLTIGRQSAFKI